MKILHMSDLHLGAKTEGTSRIPEQKQTLSEIAEIANNQEVDIAIIAGDIFHVANPSAEAEDLFYSFLEQLTKNKNRVVLVISGNHDDPKRLACCLPLAVSHNIVICTDLSPLPCYKKVEPVSIEKTDRGFVKIKKNNETVCAALLPYATKSRIEPSLSDANSNSNLSYEELLKKWASVVSKNFERASYNIFVAHQYIAGAKDMVNGKMETVGSALAASPSIFPNCNYVALGHLHTNQLVKGTKNLHYSGATTRLRLHDQAPSINVINTKDGSCTKIELKNAANIAEISATNFNDALKKLKSTNPKTLVYLNLQKITSLSAPELKELKAAGPVLLSVSFNVQNQKKQTVVKNANSVTAEELFSLFVQSKTQKKPTAEMLEMFLSLMEEENETNNA